MNIHATAMLLLFDDIQIDRLTDIGEAEMCHIDAFENQTVHQRQMPPTVVFLWCSTVETLPVIYREKTPRQTVRRHLPDIYNLTFLTFERNAQYYVHYSVLFAIERN
jgi:hypothetical protein